MQGRHAVNFTVYLVITDVLLTLLALYSAYEARLTLPLGIPLTATEIVMPGWLYPVAVVLWGAVFTFLAVYHPRQTLHVLDEIQRLLVANGLAALAFAGILYMTVREVPRLLYVYFVVFHTALLLTHRLALRGAFRLAGPRQRDVERVLVVGAGPLGREVARRVRHLKWAGLHLVGFVDTDPARVGQTVEGVPILGQMNDLIQVVRNERVDEVIFALPRHAQSGLVEMVQQLYTLPVRVRVVPDLLDLAISRASVENWEGLPLVGLNDSAIHGYYRIIKRLMDLILSSLLLVLLAPLMGVIALAIKITSPDGPVIFKQLRVGENGRLFYMYKFRTMVPDAEQRLHEVMRRLPDGTVLYKTADDPRVLPLGRFLRKYSLDELPQLFNVLKGDMSLVGPRPEIPQMLPYYKAWQWRRFTVPPGITGWWQINGRADKPMHLHTEYDVYYITHYSPWLDLYILWRTIGVVLRGRGAY